MKRWIAAILVAASISMPAHGQPASSESLAAAKELFAAMRVIDQIAAILPAIVQQMKPAIVQGRAEVSREYDRIAPLIMSRMTARLSKLADQVAALYAAHFTTDELREVTKFYQGATGKKFLQKFPELTQQTMILGGKFGEEVAADLQKEMTNELRNRGHKI